MQTQKNLDGTILAISTRNFWEGGITEKGTLERSYPEMYHRGWALVMDSQGQVQWQTEGAIEASSFFRSSAKPFQAIPLLDYGASDSLQPQEIAIACASHSGTQEHLTWVKQLLARQVGLEEPLRCGAHWPVDADTQKEMWISHEGTTSLHNNCSGKHAAMLWVCEQAGWPKHDYWHPTHPLQQSILRCISDYGQIAIGDIGIGLDGCGVPTLWLPLVTMARLYLSLITEKKLIPLANAMQQYPFLIAGPGRVDTAIMQAMPGDLLSKVGADGLICVASRKRGQVLVLKLADGNHAVRDKLVVRLLLQSGWLSGDAADLEEIKPFSDTLRYNTRDEAVGELSVMVQLSNA